MSFTDGTEDVRARRPEEPDYYVIDNTLLGRVFIPAEGVLTGGRMRVRYEKHPWMEQFELDGIRPAPPKRAGIGTKNARAFVTSLGTIYSGAFDDYRAYGGDSAFDTDGYFRHAAEYFAPLAADPDKARLYKLFSGFVENMWREGDREMLAAAMETVLPALRRDPRAWDRFYDNITDEFREYITEEKYYG